MGARVVWLLVAALPAPAADYVDPALCAGCHAALADTHQRTGMGRSFSLPRLDTPAAYYHPASDRHYTVLEREGRYFLRRHQAGDDGTSAHVLEKEIHYVVGSGNPARGLQNLPPVGESRFLRVHESALLEV